MKQHITLDQINELNEEDIKILQKWWKPMSGDAYVGDVDDVCWEAEYSVVRTDTCTIPVIDSKRYFKEIKKFIPILSIGQMIQFLNDMDMAVCIDQWINDSNRKSLKGKGAYRIGLNWFQGLEKYDYICEQKELCDALWLAVKYIIKEYKERILKTIHAKQVEE